jgi:hypothetical protein
MRRTDDMDHRNSQARDPLFDALRAEMDRQDAPHGVEKELMQAFARQFPPRRWYQARWYQPSPRRWALGTGLSAACVAVLAFSLSLQLPRGGAPESAGGTTRPLVTRGDDGLFIALDSIERIEQEPAPRMVETEVSRSSLAALGVPLTPDNAGDAVKAEMLLASDGQPLALRLRSVD